MLARSLFAVSAVAAGLFALQPAAAEAKANVNIDVYLPGADIGYYPGYYAPGYGHPIYAPARMSCFQGKQSLRWT